MPKKTASPKMRGGTTKQNPSTTAEKRMSRDKRLEAIFEVMTDELLTTL